VTTRARRNAAETKLPEFGVFDIMQVDPRISTSKSVASHLAIARDADRLGLDYAFVAERHFMPMYRAATPGLLIANLAATTQRIRLGVLAYTLPLRNPVLLAEETSMLDHLSGGRLEIGVGLGHRPQEIDSLGLPSQHRQALFLESFGLLQKLWHGAPLTFDGAAYHVRDVQVDPPEQRPHPPLWYAGNDPVVAGWAARSGLSLAIGFQNDENLRAPAAAFTHARRDSGTSRLAVMRTVYVSVTDAAAREEIIQDLMRVGADLLADPRGIDTSTMAPPTRATAERQHAEQDARQVVVSGGPDRVAEALTRTMSTLQADVLLANVHLAGIGEERVRRSLRLFAEEVVPAVRSQRIAR
jgi:alkanesulfonate monooxygenase SsuD/methylene tetrahydromethanopterin reductase-like flavin-dependent oxidoreductase (luciferase family)